MGTMNFHRATTVFPQTPRKIRDYNGGLPASQRRPSRMLKKSASIVLASFRSSTYPRWYASGLHSLRSCWAVFLSILRLIRSRNRVLGASTALRTTHGETRRAFLRRVTRERIVRGLSVVRGCFMSSDQPTRRVIALAPMPPEKSAYALARYSRSPDSIESSLRWVHGHSSEKFWDQL